MSNFSISDTTPIIQTLPMMTSGQKLNPQFFPPAVGWKSMNMNCPYCNLFIWTRVHYTLSNKNRNCFFFTWIVCCCFWPYCRDSFRNADHFCPQCGSYINTYHA